MDSKKCVFITGSAKRLGRACALRFAQRGYDIILHYHTSEDRAFQTAEEIRQFGANITIVHGDISNEKDINDIFTSISEQGIVPSIVVNNAGVFPDKVPLRDIEMSLWDEIYHINLRSQFLISREFVRIAENSSSNDVFRIINISSLGGIETWKNRAPYNVSKSGVIQLTKSLASELAPKFAVNCVCPGAISQPDDFAEQDNGLVSLHRIPMQRFGTADDIFDAIYFFSTCSPYITGQILTVDGGYHLSRT